MSTHADVTVRGPSDREVVAHLQRLARAQAHLVHAERARDDAEAARRRDRVRLGEIEEAHAALLWARAQVLTGDRGSRAERALTTAVEAERRALRRHGFASFADYVERRTARPTADIAFELAVREYESARAQWEALTADRSDDHRVAPAWPEPEVRVVHDEASATVVIDLTGERPRRIA